MSDVVRCSRSVREKMVRGGQVKRGVWVIIPWCMLRCKEKRGRGQTMSQCGEAPEFKVWAWTQKHNRAAHTETSFHPLRRPAGGGRVAHTERYLGRGFTS